jgi:hypothetical protein
VVVLTNSENPVDDIGFATLLPDAALQPSYSAIKLSLDRLDGYIGSYQVQPTLILRVARFGDQLYAQATGQAAFKLFPMATNEFFAKVGGITISFHAAPSGAVDSLTLHQDSDTVAPKIADEPAFGTYQEMEPSAAALAEYAGTYRLGDAGILTVGSQNGQLLVRLAPQPAVVVHQVAQDRFVYAEVDAQLSFERDPGGHVVALVLQQAPGAARAGAKVGFQPSIRLRY